MGARLTYPDTDQRGKVAVVTGGNTGIGYETAKGLALLGAHVIIACRNEERARGAIERMCGEVSQEHPDKTINVEFMSLDLSSLQSVKKFIEDYKQKGLPLHLLINNAGIAAVPYGKTTDGHEQHFQINHLSHFLLTLELLPVIQKPVVQDSRIVFVASHVHTRGSFNLAHLQGDQSTGDMKLYCNSKLYNIMTAYALQRRVMSKKVTVSSLTPGSVASELFRGTENTLISLYLSLDKVLGFRRNCQQGAATTLNAAVNPELNKEDGVYYSDCRVAQPSLTARSEVHQEELWRASCELVKDYMSPEVWDVYGPRSS